VLVAGENGAGKSTLMRTIAGFIRPDRGRVIFDGSDIAGLPPEEIVRRGLRLVLDGHRVFREISVRDNLRLGAVQGRTNKAEASRAMEQILATFPVLKEKIGALARDLSGGQQQMLALGQAFMASPKVLLCDEPSLGLARALLPQILDFLKAWASQGAGVIIVEQYIEFALKVADRAILFERGTIKFNVNAAEFMTHLSAA
jgi:branched-chain amino acid transport system ATP-binding protein